ncbi:MAG TPA: hypothetical protein VFH21_02730 [Burkholderiales bacterium]|nr:hypothetical protein [Burkholderiales bacterium]
MKTVLTMIAGGALLAACNDRPAPPKPNVMPEARTYTPPPTPTTPRPPIHAQPNVPQGSGTSDSK